ncbi:hypothetical protein KXD40_009155 [Peronospora effusa]|nr:hypothetical protein KXD40_009155 [Peronospora effusa]
MNGLMGALVGAINAPSTKIIVQKLLDLQYKKWREQGKDAADVRIILNLHQVEKPFDSPVLRAWIFFIKLTPLNSDNTAKTVLSVLKLVYNENVDQVLPKGVNATIEVMKHLVAKLLNPHKKGGRTISI